MSSYQWPPVSGGVPIYANLAAFPAASSVVAGKLGVAADTGTLYESNGSVWTAIAGPGAALSIGTIDSGTASANGAHIDSNALIMQSASATRPGLVNLTTQTFAGNKTFSGSISASNLSGTNTGDLTLGAVGSSANANAATLAAQVLNLEPASASFPGVVTTGIQSFAGAKTFTGAISASNLSGTNTGDITLGAVGSSANANGATLTLQALNLEPASASFPGIITTGTQSLAGAKTFTGAISASNLSGINTGDITLSAIGSSANANGASLSGQALTLQPASASFGGVLTTGTQTIAGAKTFSTSTSTPSGILTGSSSGALTLQAAATTTNHTLVFPSAQGAAYSQLTNNGSGALSWAVDPTFSTGVQNYTVVCSVATNALTIALKTLAGTDATAADPIMVSFRSATATDGTYAVVNITGALSIVVPASATLGRNVVSKDWPMNLWLISNSGTAELAVSTSAGFASIVSTTTISSGSTTTTTMYSTTGRSSVACTSIAVLTVNLANNSNYTVVPTEIVLTNGEFDAADCRAGSPLSFKQSALGAMLSGTGIAIGMAATNSGTGTVIGASANSSSDTTLAIGATSSIAGGAGSSMAIGPSAVVNTNATRAIAIGAGAGVTGADALSVGTSSAAKSARAITLGASGGYTGTAGAEGSTSIGAGASSGAFTNSIIITPGPDTTNTVDISANNQLAFGSQRSSGQVTDVRFGAGGVANTAATNVTLGITGITGADAPGKNLTIQAGNGTGTGGSGQIIFQTAPVAGSSSTINTMATRGGFGTAGGFFLNGTTSGTLTFLAGAATTNHSLTFPAAQGAANTLLTNNGSGALSWATISDSNVSASANIQYSKLDGIASGRLIIGSSGGVATVRDVTGDVTISDLGVTAISTNKVTNAMLAQVATATFKGRTTASTGNAEDLTVTQATALLNNVVGDSGSGGTKGLVPAPASGDAAAGKFLKADGTWTAPAGTGDVVGPSSATDSGFAKFDGTTGKLLKNSAATIANADVSASAAIAYSKLAALTSAQILVGSAGNVATATAVTGDVTISNSGVTAIGSGVIVNADISASAAIAYSKLDLVNLIVNADIAATAGIAATKLAATTASRAAVTDASGFFGAAAATTSTEIGYVNGVTSSIQTQLDAKTLKSTLSAKGSIYAATAASTPADLPVGANGTMLVANSAQSTGLEWKAIGTVVESTFTVAAWPIAAGQYGDLATVSLTAGTWAVSYHVYIDNNGVVTCTEVDTGVSTTPGDSGTGISVTTNGINVVPYVGTSGAAVSNDLANYIVTPGSTTTYRLKGIASTSITNLRAGGCITAIRIA